MKQIIIKISILVLFLTILLSNQIFASSNVGYTIEAYNIDMQVNEDNTFDITETITANFTGNNKHGIYRKIPLKNSVTRTDGTKSNNNAKITNISVNDNFKTSTESGYKVIKIGDANKTVSGIKTYTIKYTYNIGKDPLKNADELYFNLIGSEWDTSISNVTFKITMPKEFDKTLLGFSSGIVGSTDSSNVLYNVNGNGIIGSLKNTLYSGQALTVRLTLPEGYFVDSSANLNLDMYVICVILFCLICVLIADRLWLKYGKDEKVIETIESYPPEGYNSAEVGFLYKGEADTKDIVSLLIYLANKGYLKIEEIEEKSLFGKYKSFKIIKLKEYDGDNENEKIFFDGLFIYKKWKPIKNSDLINENLSIDKSNQRVSSDDDEVSVTEQDLYNKFYKILNTIKEKFNLDKNINKVFETSFRKKFKWLIMMIVTIFILIAGKLVLEDENSEMLIIAFLFQGIGLFMGIYSLIGKTEIIPMLFGIAFFGIFAIVVLKILTLNLIYVIMYIIGIICIAVIMLFAKIMPKRTTYGNEMLGKLKGFKRFLETVEKTQLESFVEQDPEYFYNILPYTYVLGVSDVWINKFETIAIQAPNWCYYKENFNIHTFEKFMTTTMNLASNAMASAQSSCESSDRSSFGSNSGGGSSGRGAGGGGGGSW